MGNACCNSTAVSVETITNEDQEREHERKYTNGLVHDIKKKTTDDLRSSGYSTSSRRFSTESQDEYPNGRNFQQLLSKETIEEILSGETRETQIGHSDNFAENENNDVALDRRCLTHDEQSKIKRNFSYLKSELEPELLHDYFLQYDILSEDQVDEVKSAGSRRNQVDLLLRFLLRSRTSSSYCRFLDILTEINCDHIRGTIESEHMTVSLKEYANYEQFTPRVILKTFREELVSEISDPTSIAEYFVQFEDFSIDEYELIIQEKTRKLKVERLLDIALQRDNIQRCYSVLNYALADQGYMTLNVRDKRKKIRANTDRKQVADPEQSFTLQSDPDQAASSFQDFGEAQAMRITLDIVADGNRKRQIEKKAVKKANKYKVNLIMNDTLVCDTECLITDIEKGSIVIQIKGCKDGAITNLLKMGTEQGISKILQIFLSHPDICNIFDPNTRFKVTVELLPAPQLEMKDESANPKDIISSNFEFLVEELDAPRFLNIGIFTDTEEKAILQARTKTRAGGTRCLLEYALMKSVNELERFIDEIKQRKQFVWDHIRPKESKTCLDDDVLTTGYKQLVENLSPSVILRYCIERDILHKSILSHRCFIRKLREKSAKMILHAVLQQGYRERNDFLHLIKAFEQTPWQIPVKLKEVDIIQRNITKSFPEVIFRGTCRPTTYKQTELQTGGISTKRDNISDDESGYMSLSFRKRLNRTISSESEHTDKSTYYFLKERSQCRDDCIDCIETKKTAKFDADNENRKKSPLIQGLKVQEKTQPTALGRDSEHQQPKLIHQKGPRCFPWVCFNETFDFDYTSDQPMSPIAKQRTEKGNTKRSRSVTPSLKKFPDLHPVRHHAWRPMKNTQNMDSH